MTYIELLQNDGVMRLLAYLVGFIALIAVSDRLAGRIMRSRRSRQK